MWIPTFCSKECGFPRSAQRNVDFHILLTFYQEECGFPHSAKGNVCNYTRWVKLNLKQSKFSSLSAHGGIPTIKVKIIKIKTLEEGTISRPYVLKRNTSGITPLDPVQAPTVDIPDSSQRQV
ncbi:hypothetical protein Pst134EB_003591 [Puccinia striiformis f. sp. tritici]|nr:hypothetical protein Pst134EB_003591 [Puccinia striiformis f. sp. tritici]